MAQKDEQTFGISTPTLIAAGVALLVVWKFGSSILESLGLKKDENEKANDAAATEEVAWQPTYWQKEKQTHDVLILTGSAAAAYAKTIYKYPGFFNDSYTSVAGVIKSLKTKTQVSFLCYTFQNIYNMDMYQYLRDGVPKGYIPTPGDGLSESHVKELNDYVKKLPNYKI